MRNAHIKAAQDFWKTLLNPADTAIDATLGNGHDALFLSELLPQGKLFAFDIQSKAIDSSKIKLENSPCHITFIHGSHEDFPEELPPRSVKLIVYNLGYLPGGDKTLTTKSSSTLVSLKKALSLISRRGAISVMLYPGHPEGKIEAEAVLHFAKQLDANSWTISHHTFSAQATSPSLLLIQSFA